MLTGLSRWALGLYQPSVPADLRLTETGQSESGLTPIVSAVEIPAERRERLRHYQQRQHDRRSELQEYIVARDVADALDRRGNREPKP